MSVTFEDFQLFPGALLKGSHVSLNLRDIIDVYSPQVYELVGGGRLPEQRMKPGPDSGGMQFIPGKVIEQTNSILVRGDLPDELKEYLDNAKSKMPGKFKSSVANVLIRAARLGRVKCVCQLIDQYDADVNTVSSKKKHSSLHFAAYNGDKAMAKELLTRGASKTLQNVYSETPAQTAENQLAEHTEGDVKHTKYEECRALIENFTHAEPVGAPKSGLDSISTYVPTSQSASQVDTFEALRRSSIGILNRVTDDNELRMLKQLQDLVPVTGFDRADRGADKFEVRHFQLVVVNLWKTAIAQPTMAGLYASLAAKLHAHFTACVRDITTALSTHSVKFYRKALTRG